MRGHAASPGKTGGEEGRRRRAAAAGAAGRAAALAKNGADYTIAKGDTLGSIASQNNVPGGWKAVYDRNADVLSSPHVLRVGQQLDLR